MNKGKNMTDMEFNGIVTVVMTNGDYGRPFIVETTFDELFIDNPDLKSQKTRILKKFNRGQTFVVNDMVSIVPRTEGCT